MKTPTEIKALNFQFIMNAIDGEGYGVKLTTDKEKVDFLFSTFESEFSHEIKHKGYPKAFESWLQGAPSCINIPHYYHEILEFFDKLELIDRTQNTKNIERMENELLSRYYQTVTSYAMQLKSKLENQNYLPLKFQVI